MRMKTLIATGATSALLLTPALAVAAGGPPAGEHPSGARHAHPERSHTPGPHASGKAKRKAYGTFCRSESRKHVHGEHGTPFSQCVTALAKLATGRAKNPTTACKPLSRKHVKGQHGTPFSQCVSGAAKLLDDEQGQDGGSSDDASA